MNCFKKLLAGVSCLTIYLSASGQDLPGGGGPDVINPIQIEASVVSATRPPLRIVSDTLLFSPSAYRLEDDATLEDFLKKIPGLEYNGGVITIYGRKVEKLLVNGKLYFGGDVATGLKSIAADAVENVQSYERESDYSRISGVDDGEEEPVLDVKIKKSAMGRLKGFAGAGYGTECRYRSNFNLSRMDKDRQFSAIGNLYNTPSGAAITNTSGSQLGSGADGDASHRNLGVDFNSEKKNIEINAHLKYNGYDRTQERTTSSETIRSGGTSYYRGEGLSLGENNRVSGEFQIEWRPRKDITLLVKPTVALSATQSWTNPIQYTYDADPDGGAALLNTVRQQTADFRRQADASLVFLLTKRFSKRGRSASLRFQGSYGEGGTSYFNDYLATYPKKGPSVRKQYVLSPTSRSDAYLSLSMNEPLGKGFHLQLSTSAKLVSSSLERLFYSMEDIASEGWAPPRSLSLKVAEGSLPYGYEASLDDNFTSSGRYIGKILNATASIRYFRRKLSLNGGVSVRPVWSTVNYSTSDEPNETVPDFTFYVAPTLNMRYTRSKNDFVSLTYRSWVNSPSPDRLLPVRSGTNPLIVRVGNPLLKPSFVQRVQFTYNKSVPRKGRSLVCSAQARFTDNAVSNITEYDPETGGRTIQACNISGNWSADGSVVYTHSFTGTPLSMVNTFAAQYDNDMSYLYNNKVKASELNTMRRFMAKDRMEFKADWKDFDVLLRLGAEYTDERSLLRSDMHQQPYVLLSGAEAGCTLPGKVKLNSDFSCLFQRGYAMEEMNSNFLLWNATVSKTLFKGHGTLRLLAHDILGQQVNMVRRFNSSSRSVSLYNGVGRYFLLGFTWRF